MDLFQKYKDIISGAGNLLSTAGKNIQHGIQDIAQHPLGTGLLSKVAQPIVNQVRSDLPAAQKTLSFYTQANSNPYIAYKTAQSNPSSIPSFQDIGTTGKLGLTAYGAYAAPAAVAIGGALPAAIKTVQNIRTKAPTFSDVPQAFGEGVAQGAPYAGLFGLTAPLTESVASKLAPKVGNIVAQKAVKGFTRVGEGAVNTSLLGGQYGVGQGALDFATGALLPSGPTANAKGFDVGRNSNTAWTKEDANLLDSINEYLRGKKASQFDPQSLDNLDNTISKLANGYLKQSKIDKITSDYSGNPVGMMRAFGKELNNALNNAENAGRIDTTKNIPQIVLGLTDGKKPQVPDFVATPESVRTKFGVDATLERQKISEPVRIFSDKQSVEIADIQSAGLAQNLKEEFANWVNQRKAAPVEALLKSKEFSKLDNQGVEGFFKVQAGSKSSELAPVRKYFDGKYQQLKEAGVQFNYQQDYLPQLWNNTSEEVQQVFGRTLTQRPSFTIEKIIEDYKSGIAAGLTPRFGKISDVVNWYDRTANKTLADTAYFKNLASQSMILPSNQAPRDWITLDPDRFPKFTSLTDNGKYGGAYKAPSELADMVNNYLRAPQFGFLDKVAQFTSSVKNKVLSFGVPGTAINAHGVNILARNILASSNPISGMWTGLKFMVNPNAAERELNSIMSLAPKAVRDGLTFSVEDHRVLTEAPSVKGKVSEVWNTLFEKPLFDKMLPSLKLKYYKDLVETGLDGKTAAHTANNIYGGFNWEELGKSRDMQNLKKALILAPDWAASNIDLGRNITESLINFKSPQMKPYRTFATNLFGSYVLINMANKAISGHFAFQNDPGHTFELEAGYTPDGQKRYIRPYGTAVDFLRIPADVANSVAKGDLQSVFRVIRNRLSIPAGVAIGALTDTDYAGHTIGYKGKDNYGGQMPIGQRIAGVGGEVSQLVGFPSFGKQILDTVSGKQGLEQGLTQGFELPFRYSGGAYSATQKQGRGLTGVTGKELYDQNQKLKGQTKFSDNQVKFIRSGDAKQNIDDLLLQRQINSSIRKGEPVSNDLIDQLSSPPAVSAADLYSPADTVQLKVAKQKVNLSGEEQKVGDVLVYKTSKGSVTTIPNASKYYLYKDSSGDYKKVEKSVDLKTPTVSGNDLIDIPNFTSLSKQLGSRKTNVIELFNAGMIGSAEATREISKFDAAQGLIKEIIKGLKAKSSAKSGTVTKAKVAKIKSLTKPLPRIKVPAPKSVKRVNLTTTKRFNITPPKSKKLTPRRISIK